MKKPFLILLVFCLTYFSPDIVNGQAQADDKKILGKKIPVDISFGKASVGMPFTNIFEKPVYPVLTAGTEFYYRQKENSELYQTAKINYYYAKHSTSAIVINTEIAYRYKLNCGLFADAALGAGYSHLFRPYAIYEMNDKGEYEQKRDFGSPSFMVDYAISLGYDLSGHNIPLNIYMRYCNYIDIIYAPDIPALPQSILQIGTRFYIN